MKNSLKNMFSLDGKVVFIGSNIGEIGGNSFHLAISKEDISTRRKICSTSSNKIFY